MQAIKAIDYYLLPLYLILAVLIIRALKTKLNPNKNTYKIYYTAFFIKLAGALLFAFIIQYYYGSGDSLTFFKDAHTLHDNVVSDISNLKYFFCRVEDFKNFDSSINSFAANKYDDSMVMVIRITTLFNFISFNTYLNTTIIFALLSFIGMWAIYITFISLAPDLKLQFAWGILYLPSVIFWSSGIMKDSISITSLGLLFYSFYQYFIFKKRKNIYLLTILLSAYLIFVVKYYIVIAFVITFLMVGIFYIFFKLKPIAKRILFSLLLITGILLLIFTDNSFSDAFSKISINMITDYIETMQRLYLTNKEAGEGNFSIGAIIPSIDGILSKMPLAISTVLYRPFIWESKSIVMVFSGLENAVLLVISIFIIIRTGLFKFFKLIAQNSLIQFCFFFTLIFACIVGFTTFNFGTMLRYKVPCMPFYTSFLILINYYAGMQKKSKALIQK